MYLLVSISKKTGNPTVGVTRNTIEVATKPESGRLASEAARPDLLKSLVFQFERLYDLQSQSIKNRNGIHYINPEFYH